MSQDLEAVARSLPSMGGRELGPWLRPLARLAEPPACVVELGTWMGAGTAQCALGVRPGVLVHSFDTFRMTHSAYARTRFGLDIGSGQDTLPTVQRALAPFGNVQLHRADVSQLTGQWQVPVAMLVADTCKGQGQWAAAMRYFMPALQPGAAVVLMDFFLGDKTGKHKYGAQKRWVAQHPELSYLGRPLPGCCAAAFEYQP